MCKTLTAFLFVMALSILNFASPRVLEGTIPDEINEAMKSSHPSCKPTKPLELFNVELSSYPTVRGSFECEQGRTVDLDVLLIRSESDRNWILRMFGIRSIMPPSGNVGDFGFNAAMFSTNGRVEMQFVKLNVAFLITNNFPPNKSIKGPYYYYRAPEAEELFVLNIARTLEKSGNSERYFTPCENNFAWPPVDFGVSTDEQLFTAIVRGNHERAVTLIGLGANIEADFGHAYFRTQNDEKNKPLHMAIAKGCAKTISALVDAKANVNAANGVGETPLMFAVAAQDAAVVRLLIEKGARTDARADYGLTAPFFLFSGFLNRRQGEPYDPDNADFFEILSILKENGSNLREPEPRQGSTLLHQAVLHCGSAEWCGNAIKRFAAEGVDINAVDLDGRTPLFTAVTRLNAISVSGVFELLLSLGADPEIKTKYGETVRSYIDRMSKSDEYHRKNYEPLIALLDKFAK